MDPWIPIVITASSTAALIAGVPICYGLAELGILLFALIFGA